MLTEDDMKRMEIESQAQLTSTVIIIICLLCGAILFGCAVATAWSVQ